MKLYKSNEFVKYILGSCILSTAEILYSINGIADIIDHSCKQRANDILTKMMVGVIGFVLNEAIIAVDCIDFVRRKSTNGVRSREQKERS